MFVLLVGPKGSGKSHVGRVLERELGVVFFHVEPLWIDYYARCKAEGRAPAIAEGIAEVHPRIAEALRRHEKVCVETTGASPEILQGLLSLAPPARTLIARLAAPLELCLARITARDQANQIPMDVEAIRKVHALSVAAPVAPDLVLDNEAMLDREIASRFAAALNARGMHQPQQPAEARHGRR